MQFVRKHWRKIAVGGLAVAGSVWLWEQWKAHEQSTRTPETPCVDPEGAKPALGGVDEERERQVVARMRQHFEDVQAMARDTIDQWLPVLETALNGHITTDALLASLKSNTGATGESKLATWQSLVRECVVRVVATVHAVAMLHVMFRTQLNILGRNMYLDTLQSAAPDGSAPAPAPAGHSEAQRELKTQFLSSALYLIQTRLGDLVDRIRAAATAAIGDLALDATVTRDDLHHVLSDAVARTHARAATDAPSGHPLLAFVLPPDAAATPPPPHVDPEALALLHTELAARLQSPDLTVVLEDACATGIDLALDRATAPLPGDAWPFVKTIPPMLHAAKTLTRPIPAQSPPPPRETPAPAPAPALPLPTLAAALMQVPSIEAFSALIYTDFDQPALFECRGQPDPMAALGLMRGFESLL